MLSRKALWALLVLVCLAAPVAVHAQGDYLDVFVVKVKPDRVADFTALSKKFVDANRRYNGGRWLALEVAYGEGNVYQFTSVAKDYSDVDALNQASMAALSKALGKDGAQRLLQDFSNCLVSSRSELRRRRWDLSIKAPQDADAYAKLIGEARLLRTTAVHIKPGHAPDFEALLKEIKEAAEKNPDFQPLFISQVVEGSKGATFYVSTLRSSMGGFDHNPTLREILGEDGFKKFQLISAETIEIAESSLYRFNPELSNPPEDVAKVAMDFWRPKVQIVAAAKPRTAMPPDAAKEPKKP
jgi:antibiotic biosynthesis monooxygenase (ABM) superfamily enzyme